VAGVPLLEELLAVARSEAGEGARFKLAEIKELIDGVDSKAGMAEQTRSLSGRKLDEVEELLQRTRR
jgi:hypothetical protein